MNSYRKVSIVIPVYNERATIDEVVKQVSQSDTLGIQKEIILVDDGSVDGSVEYLKSLTANDIKVFLHTRNQGKGATIRTGLQSATGDIVLIQDADLEYDPKDYPGLLQPFLNSDTEVVYGYRTKPGYKLFYLGNKVFSWFVNLLYNSDLEDTYTGYKVIKRELFNSLNLKKNGFEIEAEITSKLLKRKVKIVQVPIEYNPRTYGKGKKIKFFKDGFRGLWTFIKFRFSDMSD
jgi:glycosyltransferase involved in cell wall biosynthesis